MEEARDLEALARRASLSRGLGRSYGDASLPAEGDDVVASTLLANRVLELDEDAGVLRAEAGLRLGDLLDLMRPRGLFVPVSPGTAEVTLGGMVAADVHGKNHHVAGCLGAHVRSLKILLPDGRIEHASEDHERDVFRATLGGMGLTGHILEVTLALERVPSNAIVQQSVRYNDLESLVDELETASTKWPFTVAWSDLLARGSAMGRGVLLCGRWASADEAAGHDGGSRWPLRVPFAMPDSLLQDWNVGLFHRLRWEAAPRTPTQQVVAMDSFFHPLDAARDWNLLYGRRGFTQYQCVLPRDRAARTLRLLAETARNGGPGPFLAVIKDCGAEGRGLLSFPMPGLSLALDFPVHAGTAELVARLNDLVAEAGGRIYLAKDAFTSREHFTAMEAHRLPAFLEVKRRLDPGQRVRSALGARLGLLG